MIELNANYPGCATCEMQIPKSRAVHGAKYCSSKCAQRRRTEAYRKQNPLRGQYPSGVTGATSEVLACADLLYRGYAVFRAVSPFCECDLIVLRDGKTCRVEVKTAYKKGNGAVQASLRNDQRGKYDVLAMVFLGANVIEYRPDLREVSLRLAGTE